MNPSSELTASTGTGSFNGVGNVYTQIRFTELKPGFSFLSTLAGTAPTGDRAKGLSTGHATVDWSNYLEGHLGRLTPFGELGFANAISDTEYFTRPYVTQGFVTHFQGGSRYRLFGPVSVGIAGYAYVPAGDQTVFSRVTTVTQTAADAVTGAGRGLVNTGNSVRSNRVFETTQTVTGSASIARDEGGSAWLLFQSAHTANFYAGFTRSARYQLNTFYVGVGLNVRKPIGVF